MTEWLKNICTSTFQYGLDKINQAATNVISIIFNTYGDRLFNLNQNKIIEKNESIDQKNIFYFYPLHLSENVQTFGSNTIKIKCGTINNLVLSIPWKSLLMDSTEIVAESVHLKISLEKTVHDLSVSMINHSYFRNSMIETDDQDLISVFVEIKAILCQYFSNLKLKINRLSIDLTNSFVIELEDITLTEDLLTVQKISIDELLLISNFVYQIDQSKISIDKIKCCSDLVQHLPVIYLDNDQDQKMNIELNIGCLILDEIIINECSIVNNNGLIIKNISSIVLDDVFYYENINGNNFLMSMESNIVTVGQLINVKIHQHHVLKNYFEKYQSKIRILQEKFVSNDISDPSLMTVKNIKINLIYGDDCYFLTIKEIVINKNIQLKYIRCEYMNVVILIDCIDYCTNKTVINKTSINGGNFSLDSQKIVFNEPNTVEVINAKVVQVKELIDFVKIFNATDNSDSDVSPVTPFYLNFVNTSFCNKYENHQINIIIQKASVSVSDKSVENLYADISWDNCLLGKIDNASFTPERLEINEIIINLDPEIFDQINYVFGTLSKEKDDNYTLNLSEEGINELRDALNRSVHKSSVIELKEDYQMISSDIISKFSCCKNLSLFGKLSESLHSSFHLNQNRFRFVVKTVRCYLYNSMCDGQKPFLCLMTKENTIVHNKKRYHTNDHTHVKILEDNSLQKPETLDEYSVKIKSGNIYDLSSLNTRWKNFIKFSQDEMLDVSLIIHGNELNIDIRLSPVVAFIKEETLIKLLAFFSNNHHPPKKNNSIYIKRFFINKIDIALNYNPLILKKIGLETNKLTIRNFNFSLMQQEINYVDNLNILSSMIMEKIKSEFNPNSIIKFIPKVGIIEPYTSPVVDFFSLITKYFKYSQNKSKLRYLLKQNNLIQTLIKFQIDKVSGWFSQNSHLIKYF